MCIPPLGQPTATYSAVLPYERAKHLLVARPLHRQAYRPPSTDAAGDPVGDDLPSLEELERHLAARAATESAKARANGVKLIGRPQL